MRKGLPWRIGMVSRAGRSDPRTLVVLDQMASPLRRYGGDLITQVTSTAGRVTHRHCSERLSGIVDSGALKFDDPVDE
jgi:hypothetical protein